MSKKKILLSISSAIIVVIAFLLLSGPPTVEIEPSFVGNSTELKKTNIVATLDTPIDENMNTIWCASFVAAWKSIERDITKEPIALDGDPKIATRLSNAQDPSRYVPASSLYAIAGWNDEGIQEQIRIDLARKFPRKQPPEFSDIPEDSFLAYAYLEVSLPFTYKFERNYEEMLFTDISGKRTSVTSFGLPDLVHIDPRLQSQPKVLYNDMNENREVNEYVIDLDKYSKEDQIIVAYIAPELTLGMSVKKVQLRIADTEASGDWSSSPTVLLVPDTVWQVAHRFSDIENHRFSSPKMKGQPITVALQDTSFRLDHEGAVLKSEAGMYAAESAEPEFSGHYVFDRPFLLYMKKRDADMPYFVMWVANAELLNPWTED